MDKASHMEDNLLMEDKHHPMEDKHNLMEDKHHPMEDKHNLMEDRLPMMVKEVA